MHKKIKKRGAARCTVLTLGRGWVGNQIEQAEEALKLHRGTGRLWAVLVQLRQPDGQRAQLEVLERALREVPKSGEVWCEAARVALAVNSCFFDLELARTYLEVCVWLVVGCRGHKPRQHILFSDLTPSARCLSCTSLLFSLHRSTGTHLSS